MAREANMRKYTLTVAENSRGGLDCSARIVSTLPGDVVRRQFDIDPVVFTEDATDRAYPLRVEDAVIDLACKISRLLWNAMATEPLTHWADVSGTGVLDYLSADKPVDAAVREQ